MSIYSYGARLGRTDLTDLDAASSRLAAAAGAIRRANPSWGEAVVQLIYEANLVIVRIQGKGAAAFARYIEKHGLEKPQDEPGFADPGKSHPPSNNAPSEPPEKA